MRLGIAYSSCDAVENTETTLRALWESKHFSSYALHWVDGSRDPIALDFLDSYENKTTQAERNIRGGADAAIAYKLSLLLLHPAEYTHIGLLENDVLLDADWLEPTIELFVKGERDGLAVGAVSARSYVNRVLIQRDGYGVMHNMGAGMVIFTREAAGIILRTFRTHWWQDNVRLFAHVCGSDLRTFAAFGGNEQWVTTDWGFEAQLARHGLAALALTPARCQMIGQKLPLEQQGLELTTEAGRKTNQEALEYSDRCFELYRSNINRLRWGETILERPGMLHRDGAGMLFFPHQMGAIDAQWQGILDLKWSQGFGPFAYRAGAGGASLSAHVSGICSFLVSGGVAGASLRIRDARSGFKAEPALPVEQEIITLGVPGTSTPRLLVMDMAEGAVFYGLHCNDPQMLDTSFSFTWSQLPEAA